MLSAGLLWSLTLGLQLTLAGLAMPPSLCSVTEIIRMSTNLIPYSLGVLEASIEIKCRAYLLRPHHPWVSSAPPITSLALVWQMAWTVGTHCDVVDDDALLE